MSLLHGKSQYFKEKALLLCTFNLRIYVTDFIYCKRIEEKKKRHITNISFLKSLPKDFREVSFPVQ